jgi:transcriptional regulator with XRE-family HTH domain
MSFSSTLVDLRARAGLSQRALALALGVSSTSLMRWERGWGLPTARRMQQLANALGTDVGTLSRAAREGR